MIDHYKIIKKSDHIQYLITYILNQIQLEKEIKREFNKLNEV